MKLDSMRSRYEGQFSPHFTGFRCGGGWYDLIDETLEELRRVAPNARVTTIKEKIATLRVYVEDKMDERAKEVLRHAEERSRSICEVCGSAGSRRGGQGWVQTLCAEHAVGTTPETCDDHGDTHG